MGIALHLSPRDDVPSASLQLMGKIGANMIGERDTASCTSVDYRSTYLWRSFLWRYERAPSQT